MNTRKWIVVGCVTGTLALVLLTVLATCAVTTDKPMTPGQLVLGIIDVLLGMASLKCLGDAATMAQIERCTNRYVEGVGDTVDRLASVLPHEGKVRQIR